MPIGFRHSPETREKMAAAKRGKLNPNWGKPMSAETAARLRKAQSEKPLSDESRARIRSSKLGKLNPNWGKHPSTETRAKMSKAHTGRTHTAEARAKISHAKMGNTDSLGVPRSKEWRLNMSRIQTLRYQNPDARRQTSEARKRNWQNPEYRDRIIRAALKGSQVRPTAPESKVRSILDARFPGEWKYVGDGDVVIGGKNPDFINVNGQKSVVEVFGDWWHGEERTGVPNEKAVSARIAHFAKHGFRCAVVWESEAQEEQVIVDRVEALA